MEKRKKWRGIALTLLTLLFFVVMSYAVVRVLPAGADENLDIAYTQQGESGPYFIYDDAQNRYTLNGIADMGAAEKTATITLTFTGAKYFTFAYELLNADPAFLNVKIVVDGSTMTKTSSSDLENNDYGILNGILPATGADSEVDATSKKVWLHVNTAGEHAVVITVSGTADAVAAETEKCFFENFSISDTSPETIKVTLIYDAYLATLHTTNTNDIVPAPDPVRENTTIVEHELELPVGDCIHVILKSKQNIASTLNGKMTKSLWDTSENGVQSNFEKLSSDGRNDPMHPSGGMSPSSTSQWCYIYANIEGMFGLKQQGGQAQVVYHELKDGEAAPVVKYSFKEVAVAPMVSVVKNAEAEEEVTSGQNVTVPFGEANTLTVRAKIFDGLEASDYIVKIDDKPYEGLTAFEGYIGFGLAGNEISNRNINISCNNKKAIATPSNKAYEDGFLYSKYDFETSPSMNFTTELVVDDGIDSILHSDNIAVSNDETYPWILDPENSGEGQYAFMPKNSSKKGDIKYPFSYPYAAGSVLTFSFSEEQQGSLSFEFKLAGTAWDMSMISPSLTGVGAQAFYRFDQPFVQSEYATCVKAQGSIPNGAMLIARPGADGLMGYGDGISELGDGWYRIRISVDARSVEKVYVAFVAGQSQASVSSSMPIENDNFMTIRNVRFVTGNTNITVQSNSIGSSSTITASVDSDVREERTKETFNVPAGSYVKLKANPSDDEVFYGWVVNDEFYSGKEEISLSIEKETTIIGYMAPKDYYKARISGTFYQELTGESGALKAAGSSGSVVLCGSSLKISGSFEIPAGVSVILPFNADGEYYGSGAPSGKYESGTQIAWASEELIKKYKNFELTIDENAKLTINGTLIVGGVLNHEGQGYQGHTSGAYAELVLNGTIEVVDGGVMDVYGRVTGKGSIDVKSGGKLYEPFLILDFDGGTNTFDLFMANQTPFRRYAMINITVPFTIHYGAQLLGHASLWVSGMIVSLDQPFISYDMGEERGGDGNGNDTFVMLSEGSKVALTYDPKQVVDGSNNKNCTEGIGKITMIFDGGATFSYMQFSAMGITVPTNPVYFSIPYNYEVEMNGDGANYETTTDFMIMPGAKVTVGEKATLTLNANAYVYDGLVQGALSSKSYPTAVQLKEAGYSESGNLIVNGTLKIGRKTTVKKFEISTGSGAFVPEEIGATFLGIVQTGGSGRIEIPHEDTVLSGTIFDGLEKKTYFAYTTTARVWNKVTNDFADLVAGQNYTATSGGQFTLNELKYTATKDGEETLTLSLTSDMVGTWMVEHAVHEFDWSGAEELPSAENKHTQVSRTCTVMGCGHEETRELVFAPTDWGHLIYTGDVFGEAEIKAKINEWFGDYDVFEQAGGAVSFADFTDCNEAGYEVTVTLSKGFWVSGGSYTPSSTELTLRIYVDKATLTDEDVTMSEDAVTYTGDVITKEVTVTFHGKTLEKQTDYEVTYSADHTNVGTVTVTITGSGTNFTGTVTKTFQIVARNIADAEVRLAGETVYTGEKIQPQVTSVTVGGKQLSGGEYTVEYGDNTDAGENAGTVTIQAAEGNYTGTATVTFTIEKATLESATIDGQSEFTYNGKAQTVKVDAKTANGLTIPESEYTITYDNNIKAGTVTATVTVNAGSKNYADKAGVTVTFTIKKKAVTVTVSKQEKEFNNAEQAYDAEEVDAWTADGLENGEEKSVLGVQLKGNGKDAKSYDVTASYNEEGNYTVTFEGAEGLSVGEGNVIEGALVITPKDASGATVEVTGTYTYDSEAQEVAVNVTVAGIDGALALGTDYTIAYTGDHTEANKTAGFTVNFQGNYEGSASQTFEIKQAEVKVTPNPAESPEGEAQADLTYQIEGTMYGNDKATLEGGITLKIENGADVTQASAGETFNIVAELAEGIAEQLKNYKIDTSAKGIYTILAAVFKDVTVEEGTTVVYDGQTHGIKAKGVPYGAQDSYAYSVEGGAPIVGEPKDAGKYTVTVTITLGEYKPYQVTRTLTISPKPVEVTLLAQSATYNGQPQQAQTGEDFYEIAEDAIVGADEVLFTLSSEALTDVGSTQIKLTVTGTAAGNYSVTPTQAQFTVKPLALGEDSVAVTSNHIYDGTQQTPQLQVTANGLPVSEGDYDVTYQGDRTNAGEVTVTVTMKEEKNFSGTASTTFTIAKAKLSGAAVTGTYIYDRTPQEPQLTVTATGGGEKTLTLEQGDYTFSVEGAHTDAGTVHVTVTAAEESNYEGTMSATYEIKPATIDKFEVAESDLVYTGTKHELTLIVGAGTLTLAPDTEYQLTVEGDLTGAGQHTLTVKGTGNFTGEKQLTVTVKAAKLSGVTVEGTYVYDGNAKTPKLTVSAGELLPGEGDYTVSYEGNLTYAGEVKVTVSGKGNYQGSAETKFQIEKAVISVTLEDHTSLYGEPFEKLTFTYEGVVEKDATSVLPDSYLTIVTEATEKKNAAEYPITATAEQGLSNYTIEIVNTATYTVTARKVTVEIGDQGATYDPEKAKDGSYTFDAAAWSIVANLGDGLAANENGAVLGIVLSVGKLEHAGAYVITGTSSNTNYDVTFTGNYNGEDENKGQAGVYAIQKLDVSEDVIFILLVGEEGDEGAMEGDRTVRVKYAGKPLPLSCEATLYMGETKFELVTVLDHTSIDGEGNLTVAVTIEDTDYCGGTEFVVIVTDANGYTEHLKDVLALLKTLVEGLDKEALKAEDYESLVKVYEALESLDEAEQEVGAAELATYREYVDAWEALADIEDVVETAKAVADAPIEALFEAAAVLTALAGLAYIAFKGGLL